MPLAKLLCLQEQLDPPGRTGKFAKLRGSTAVLSGIETKVALNQTADLALDAVSLASIYFLAAIGLAITFGVMGVTTLNE